MNKFYFIVLFSLCSFTYGKTIMILDTIKKNILDNQRFLSVNESIIKSNFLANNYDLDIFSGAKGSSLNNGDYRVNFIYRYDALQREFSLKKDKAEGYFVVVFRVNKSGNNNIEIIKYINFFYKNIFGVSLSDNEFNSILADSNFSTYLFDNEKGSFGIKRLTPDDSYKYFQLYLFK